MSTVVSAALILGGVFLLGCAAGVWWGQRRDGRVLAAEAEQWLGERRRVDW